MSIYHLTYSKLGQRLLPPDKRNSRLIAFVTCLLAPMQWLRDLWFGSYRRGATAAPYSAGTTYSKYARVLYNKVMYESLQNANTGNAPPTSPVYWFAVQQNFIGLSERLLYTGQILTLTWAMNRWFGTNFVQPPNTGASGIYISNNAVPVSPFVVAANDANSSDTYTGGSTEYIINGYSFANKINFTIYVPVAVYNALDTTGANNEAIFRSFVNIYLPAGLIYNIQTY